MRRLSARLHGVASWAAVAAAVLAVAWIGWRLWSERPLEVTVRFAEVHGLERDAPVRVRGAKVGSVSSLRADGDGVEVTLRLERSAAGLAREGARFWIVRPEVGPEGIYGLETVLGPRYVLATPGEGERRLRFRGEEEPPLEGLGPPDRWVRVRLAARRRGGLRPGAALTFRGALVGRVVEADLSEDGDAVAIEALLRGDRAGLLRRGTRFVRDRGVRSDVLLRVLHWEIGGRVAEAAFGDTIRIEVPADAFGRVGPGAVFPLLEEEEIDAAHEAAPAVCLDPERVPPCGLATVRLRREGFGLFGRGALTGVAVRWKGALVGPWDLLDPASEGAASVVSKDASTGEQREIHLVAGHPLAVAAGVTALFLEGEGGGEVVPRRAEGAPKGRLFAFPLGGAGWPYPLGRSPGPPGEATWRPEREVPPGLHGAPVLDEEGRWVGVLLGREGGAEVVWLPPA